MFFLFYPSARMKFAWIGNRGQFLFVAVQHAGKLRPAPFKVESPLIHAAQHVQSRSIVAWLDFQALPALSVENSEKALVDRRVQKHDAVGQIEKAVAGFAVGKKLN